MIVSSTRHLMSTISKTFHACGCFLLPFLLVLWAAGAAATAEGEGPAAGAGDVVTYEAFGAVGDGVADDLPAIQRAHAYANEHGLPVRSNPGATYHLGTRAITVEIATDTDWGESRFIIDDSDGVENHRHPLFRVVSLLEPLPLEIETLESGQERIDVELPVDCLVYVENRNRRLFIRRGLNRNSGSVQREVFVLRKDGTIFGGIDWDYEEVTRVEAMPIDPETLVLRGGRFTSIANRIDQEVGYNYSARNIEISRSNTLVEGVVLNVTGETDVGHPYRGFLHVRRCAFVELRNCTIDARKTYQTIGRAGSPVSMGTYGYQADFVVNLRMIGCRQGTDIHDRSRWGIAGTNFMKNVLLEDCELSRMDVHQGVSGEYIIRRSTLGHAGLNAIGRGRLLVEDSILHGTHLVSFRGDYGSKWDGVVEIRNSRWVPPADRVRRPVLFGMRNDGTHDFGYECHAPREIRIDGLSIDDSGRPENYEGPSFFGDPIGADPGERPYPFRFGGVIQVSGLVTASGLPPTVSDRPEVEEAYEVKGEISFEG